MTVYICLQIMLNDIDGVLDSQINDTQQTDMCIS